jgi:hypothetical protein
MIFHQISLAGALNIPSNMIHDDITFFCQVLLFRKSFLDVLADMPVAVLELTVGY